MRVNIRCHICLQQATVVIILHRCCRLVVYNRSCSVPPVVHFCELGGARTLLGNSQRCRSAVPLRPKQWRNQELGTPGQISQSSPPSLFSHPLSPFRSIPLPFTLPPFARRTPLQRVCCCGPGQQAISIDCCPALSSSRDAQQSMRAVPRCQPTYGVGMRACNRFNV